MAAENSFDIACKIDMQEVTNALDQARREIETRYDLKGSKNELTLDKTDITVTAADDMKLKAVVDILQSRLHKRGVPLKALTYGTVEEASGGARRQKTSVHHGILTDAPSEVAPPINDTKADVCAALAAVEPWVDVNPTGSRNLVAVWQQDRWSNGGAHGLVTAFTKDGGATWAIRTPHFSRCAGGTAANGGDYDRASDPWVSFAPNGDAYQISLSVNLFENFVTAILVSKSTDGGDHWSEPVTLIRDTDPRFFNDKET